MGCDTQFRVSFWDRVEIFSPKGKVFEDPEKIGEGKSQQGWSVCGEERKKNPGRDLEKKF